MSKHDQNDPLEQALAGCPVDGTQEDLRMQQVLRKAKRSVGTKDIFGLMLVNLWVTLAKVVAPFFTVRQNTNSKK